MEAYPADQAGHGTSHHRAVKGWPHPQYSAYRNAYTPTTPTPLRKQPAFETRRPLGHRSTASTGSLSLASTHSSTSGNTLIDDPFAYPTTTAQKQLKPQTTPQRLQFTLDPHLHRAASARTTPSRPSHLTHSPHSHQYSSYRLASAFVTPPRTRTTKRSQPSLAVLSIPSTDPMATLSPPPTSVPGHGHSFAQDQARSPGGSVHSNGSHYEYARNRQSYDGAHPRRPALAMTVPNPGSSSSIHQAVGPDDGRQSRRTTSRSERLLRDTLRKDERVRSLSRVRARSGSDASVNSSYEPISVGLGLVAPTPIAAPPFGRSHTVLALSPARPNPNGNGAAANPSPSRPHLVHAPASSPTGLPVLSASPTIMSPINRRTTNTRTGSPSATRERDLSFTPMHQYQHQIQNQQYQQYHGQHPRRSGSSHEDSTGNATGTAPGMNNCTCHHALTRTQSARLPPRRRGSAPHTRQNSVADLNSMKSSSSVIVDRNGPVAPLTPPPTPPLAASRLPARTAASRRSSVDMRPTVSSPGASSMGGGGRGSPSPLGTPSPMHSPMCPMSGNSNPMEASGSSRNPNLKLSASDLAGHIGAVAGSDGHGHGHGTHTSSGSSGYVDESPVTPPTPRFDVHTAAAQAKATQGYVAFGDVEGLGVPDGLDGDESEREVLKNQNAAGARARAGSGMGKGIAKVLAWWGQ